MVRIAHLSDLHVTHVVSNLVRIAQLVLPRSAGESAWDITARIVSATWLKRSSLFEPFLRSTHLIPSYQTRNLVAVVQSAREQRCDHVIVTGDVANLGAESELFEAKMILQAFGYDAAHVTMAPGNHDVVNFFGVAEFQNVMELSPWPHLSWISPQIVAVVLDSTVYGPELDWRDALGLNARGGFSDEDLQRTEELLRSIPQGVFKIICCHHHLVDLPPDGYVDQLAEKFDRRQADPADRADEVLDLAEKYGVGLLLFGHRHRATHHLFTIRGIPACCGGSVTEVSKSGHLRYRVFDFEDGMIRRRKWIDVLPSSANREVVEQVLHDVSSVPRDDGWKLTHPIRGASLKSDIADAVEKQKAQNKQMLQQIKKRLENGKL